MIMRRCATSIRSSLSTRSTSRLEAGSGHDPELQAQPGRWLCPACGRGSRLDAAAGLSGTTNGRQLPCARSPRRAVSMAGTALESPESTGTLSRWGRFGRTGGTDRTSTGCGQWPCTSSSRSTPGSCDFDGGFIGVDVFFVLSGYLVTSLLLRDVATVGGVRLRQFYSRRIRRLLPAGRREPDCHRRRLRCDRFPDRGSECSRCGPRRCALCRQLVLHWPVGRLLRAAILRRAR